MKKLLAPKSKEMPHAVLDSHDNLLTDPEVIRNEYKAEFQYRLRKRDIRSGLEWFDNFFYFRKCEIWTLNFTSSFDTKFK